MWESVIYTRVAWTMAITQSQGTDFNFVYNRSLTLALFMTGH